MRSLWILALLLASFPQFVPAADQGAQAPDVRDTGSYAGPKDPVDFPKLVDQSSLIVVAEVRRLLDSPGEYFSDENVHRAQLYAAEVSVREVLKGEFPPGTLVVGGMLPIRPNRKPPLSANTVRMFFLKRENNSWRFADPFFGVMVAAPVTPRPVDGTAYDKVMAQLLNTLQSDLISSSERIELISQLRGNPDSRIIPALKAELNESRDEALTSALLAALIERNYKEAVIKAHQFLTTSNSRYAGTLLIAMAELNRPDLLPEIVAGLKSDTSAVRMGAAIALNSSDLPEALPPLMGALDSSDRHLVTQVMILLAARYKHPEWSPSWDDDKHWEDMLHHWKQFRENPPPPPPKEAHK